MVGDFQSGIVENDENSALCNTKYFMYVKGKKLMQGGFGERFILELLADSTKKE